VIYERRPNEVVLTFPNGMVQTIGLWREEIHNGGHRTWFYLDGRRTNRLWLAPDEDRFKDRRSLGLEYACRRVGRRRREARRAEKIFEKLGPKALGGHDIRPSGMHSSTWRALLGRLDRIRPGRTRRPTS